MMYLFSLRVAHAAHGHAVGGTAGVVLYRPHPSVPLKLTEHPVHAQVWEFNPQP